VNGVANDEEKLAQKAIARIRGWLENRETASRKILGPRLGVKFCGGCNPSFDRMAVAQILRRDLPDVRWVPADEEADLLLIINGCFGSCAERPDVKEKAIENLIIRNHSVSAIKKRGES
jgi:hypothetical protein